jgi:hypothetical protein
MFELSIDIKPNPRFCAHLVGELERELRNMRPPLTDVVDDIMRPAIIEHFAMGGPGWEPISAETRKRRARAGIEGDDPLVATGRLEQAAAMRARWSITRDHAFFYNLPQSQRHGFYHQHGARDGHFPARPFARVDTGDSLRANRVFSNWVQRSIRTELSIPWR